MTTTTLDKPVKKPTFQSVSTSRKIKNEVARVAFVLCFAVTLIPLVWVLWTVLEKG